ncbi:hypothetical protein GCM10028811_14980 [Uliginosibacterium sediminicola]
MAWLRSEEWAAASEAGDWALACALTKTQAAASHARRAGARTACVAGEVRIKCMVDWVPWQPMSALFS